MIRKAFLMTLKPGKQKEYERRHAEVWPELLGVLKKHGVSNYSIFLDRESDKLFAYAEIESETRWMQIGETDVCRRWWAEMSELMCTKPDKSPAKTSLDEVFHLE